ncbi:MAG: sigma-54-dependent Fis family transcriptional regulator [Bdellovibrionales bacterium]|nr:sigma-54-dependent Fis family transcriptional regulator [Bdellovibrionales bacterium]
MSTQHLRVLIVDDEESVRTLIEGRLARRGFTVACAASGEAALKLAREFEPLALITDLRMPGMDGFAVMQALPELPTIIITGHGDKESAIHAVETGAFAFFEKPFDLDALEVMAKRACEKRVMSLEREALLRKLDTLVKSQGRELESIDAKFGPTSFVGDSPGIREIKSILARLAQKPHAGLLILGETGTGKEVVARELHRLTHPKSTGENGRTPFLALNCSAIPADLLESELFGHEKGAFSGAHATRMGLAEAVREGTLFLDEIGELDPRHQAKILRLLQERSFRRVGANQDLNFQGRIVAATHRDLPRLASEGSFREDLYYRLSVVSVVLPPLRQRPDDLPKLMETLCRRHGLKGLSKESERQALAHKWPGNIRELNNWIERAAILGLHDEKGFVTEGLGQGVGASSAGTASASNAPGNLLSLVPNVDESDDLKTLRTKVLDEFDKRWIEKALDENAGNVSAAAKVLGIDRKNLARRIKDLNLKRAA